MSNALRAVVVVGLVAVLLAVGGAVVADDHPEHEHPDEVEDEDDLAGLERWLGDRMGEIHVDCTEGMRVGDFDACEDLDEEYESLLERYVTAERETTADEDDRQGERFAETREKQGELAELMEQFDETHDEYREARERGDEHRARETARELIVLADRIEEVGGDVEANFRTIDDAVSGDLNESADVTREMTDEVVLRVEEIERESFEPTNVTFSVDERASFAAPATATGTVTDENGTAVPDARVVLEDDENAFETWTGEDGEYELEYRPTLTEIGETDLTVRHVPEDASEFLGSNATASVAVAPTASSVAVTGSTSEAAFAENVTVAGDVGAAGEPVADVPVVIAVEGERLATVRTDEAGQFEATGPLPATVPDGEATVLVRSSEPRLALWPATDATSLFVRETDTELSVTTTDVDGDVEISGRLTADADEDVGQRPLIVTIAGEERSVTTDDDGRYSVTTGGEAEPRDVVVEYDEPGTNLAPSRAETTIESDRGALGSAIGGARGHLATFFAMLRNSPALAALFLAGVAVTVVVSGLIWRKLRRSGAEAADPALADDPGNRPWSASDQSPSDGPSNAVLLLEAARDRLESSPEAAVQVCYAAVRSGLGGGVDERTHWEFYTEFRGDLEARRAAALRSVTESFEQATFARTGIDTERARAALEDAERCLAASDGGTDQPSERSAATDEPTD